MAASAEKGYRPIGIDIKLESARAAREVLKDLGLPGYVVVADVEYLPFAEETFDLIWSFSVIQHTHKKKARGCLDGIVRCLKPGGSCTLEFPNKSGLWNLVVRNCRTEDEEDLKSWCVRYYSVRELEHLFTSRFGNFQYWAHCYFGLGLLPVDLKWVPLRFRPIVLASLGLTALSKVVPPLRQVADSIYCRSVKQGSIRSGLSHSAPFDDSVPDPNLAILPMLRCPQTLNRLELDLEGKRLLNRQAGIAYPIVEGIPILLPERATLVS
jgi:SAM-dependent methyltransferase